MYVKDFYGRLCWRYVGRNDANYSIRIDNNRKITVDSKKEEEVPTIEDLKTNNPLNHKTIDFQ
jgi:hypothetical protein